MSPRRDMTFGSQAEMRAPSGTGGSTEQQAALNIQLRRLRSWEDPADTSSTASVYREMLAEADERGGPLPCPGGSYSLKSRQAS